MKKKVLMTVIAQIITVGLVFGFFGSSVMAGNVQIKAATFHPAKHRLTTDAFTVWGKEVEKRTNGEVNFKWFLGGSLVKPPQMHKALESGLADLAVPLTGWFPNLYPVTQGISLPFMVDTPLHSAMVLHEMYLTIPEMKKEYKKMVPIAFFTTAVEQIQVIGDPPKSVAELSKFKVGCPGQKEIRFAKDLGIVPQHLKLGDLYMALQRDMVNAIIFPTAPTRSWKLTEILNGHTVGNFFVVPFAIGMSHQAWKKLSPESKQQITDLSESYSALLGTTLLNEDKWVMDELKARGDKFHYLTSAEKAEWKEATQKQYVDYVKSLNDRGMDGEAVLAKIEAIADKWRNKLYAPESWWGRAGKK